MNTNVINNTFLAFVTVIESAYYRYLGMRPDRHEDHRFGFLESKGGSNDINNKREVTTVGES